VSEWTKEDEDRLIEMAGRKMSAGKIGKEMGRSRNSVIGKMDRMGLKRHPHAPRRSRKRASPVREKPSLAEARPTRLVHPTEVGEGCLFPYGHPGERDFGMCGRVRERHKPYCTSHCAIAYAKDRHEQAKTHEEPARQGGEDAAV
jgi:GcrA cell cycle regulator